MDNFLKRLKTGVRIKLGYGAGFILLLLSYILTWYANEEVIIQSRWVIRSNTLINHLESLLSYVKDAETGVRGYVISKDKNFLEPYNSSRPQVDSTFSLLKEETKENTSQQILLYKVKELIDKRYDILDSVLLRLDANSFVIPRLNGRHEGKEIMDSIRLEVGIMKVEEQKVFSNRNKKLHAQYVTMNIIIVTSLVLAFIFAGFGLITYLNENKARKVSDKKVLEYQEELKQRIDELATANKELVEMRNREQFAATGRIARTIAHEVRNPLTNIDLAVSQLKTEVTSMDENSAMLFDMVNRNSKRINQLITELLNATRFADLNYQPAVINDILDETLELANDRIALNHITIEKKYEQNIGKILVDKEKIKIAFLNIIVNAAEAMDSGDGFLKIITKTVDNKCEVEISDNGVGIDTATKDRLFEPYFTTKTKGNGLGLTNTQNIILNHKATINVESKPGKGTTFIIRFNFISDSQ